MIAETQERRKRRFRIALPDELKSVYRRLLVPVCAMVAACLGLAALLGWVLDLPFLAGLGPEKIPMAPSTAILFVLYGMSIFLRPRLPHRGVYWTALSVHATGVLIVLLLGVLAYQGIHPEAEHLGISIPHPPGLKLVGHMSPVTAFCFLLSSLSFLASLPTSLVRPWRAFAAICPACLLLAISPLLVMASLFGTPLFYHGAFILAALPSSMSFVALGTALLALALPQARQSLRQAEPATRFPYNLIVIFIILIMGVLSAGFFLYQGYERRCRIEVERQLAAVAEMKKAELVKWRGERLTDASFIYKNIVFSTMVSRYVTNPEDSETEQHLSKWIGQYLKNSEYDQVRLLDPQGVTRMSSPAGRPPASAAVLNGMARVLQTGHITIVDLYRHDHDQRIYLSVLIPILDVSVDTRVIAVLSLRVDPEKYLYPFILHWPLPSQTVETLLFRREGDEVLFLNNLKFREKAALTHRVSLERTNASPVMAVLGQTGIVEGLAYRGEVPVIADVRPVPDSPWFLMVRMNISEVYAQARGHLWMILGLMTALVFGAGAGLTFVWRQQSQGFYRERLAAAEALARNEKKYRLLIEGLQEGIWQIDKDGNTSFVNKSMAQMLGYTVEEMLGRHLSSFMDERAKTIAEQNIERRKQGIVEQHDFEFLHKDGSRIYTTIETSPILDEAGNYNGALAGVMNITDRKQREETLLLHSQIMRNLAEGINLIRIEDGMIVFVNQIFEQMFGYEPGEMIGKNIAIVNAPGDKAPEETKKAIIDTLAETGEWHGEIENIRKDGTRFWCYANVSSFEHPEYGRVCVSVHTDISERKRADERIRESEKRLRYAQQIAGLGFWDWNVVTGDLYWSNETYIHYGFKPQEFVPTLAKFSSIVHPDDLAFVQQHVDASLQNDAEYNIEFRFVRPNGEIRYLYTRGEVTRDAEGKAIRFVGSQMDITERKRTEEQIRRSLAEKEVMLKEIHHRVKNNMQVIYSLLSLQADNIEDSSVKAMFEEGRNRIGSMALIHEKLYRSEDLAQIDFKEYLQNLVQGIADTYKRCDVHLSLEMEPIFFDVNVGIPCGLIVNELISNSLKHAFPEGRKGLIRVGINKNSEGNYVLIVEDNGIGFPAEKDFRKTSSLGLRLVNVLTGQIHGTIALSRTEGTRFSITFPFPIR